MEQIFKCVLGIGPAIEDGFYYDGFMPDGRGISQTDFKDVEAAFKKIVKKKYVFERILVNKADALDLFSYSKFKIELISENVGESDLCSIYRCGDFVDFCRGPHVHDTGRIKAFACAKCGASFWKGDEKRDSLQRITGISFANPKDLKVWKIMIEEAKLRNHKRLGIQHELFFFHDLSPGSPFFLPAGTHIYHTLQNFIREKYRKYGYDEVKTPNIMNSELWKQSGHWDHYKKNMFILEKEEAKGEEEPPCFSCAPMNCPKHCLMFNWRSRSYKELPWRVADFCGLHRNEKSGALTGLTRVRRFQQDDAHIFCLPSQVKTEIKGVLDFIEEVYGVFGFSFSLALSTRDPDDFMGEVSEWDTAEAQLEEALKDFGRPFGINPKDGAFYGPKIDIELTDALGRKHQCATIQLDFQLPRRFDLSVDVPLSEAELEEEKKRVELLKKEWETKQTTEGGEKETEEKEGEEAEEKPDFRIHRSRPVRPVMVHRAILGSVERFMAILIESTACKFPLWVSPRQVCVIPVGNKFLGYAEHVKTRLFDAGFQVEVDDTPEMLKKKIRNAQLRQFNYILVVGASEEEEESVNVRTRSNVVEGTMKLVDFIERCEKEIKERKME
eukprot:gnl/Carplike_NY0171/1318_a1785_1089.p1 GENE.gnl/Carplike_NY0171/1318_a1785_1089~~gnl/Carplike_NY0171/1318_a1785_1089.p1  ORF type:complete len:720 (+),score=230.09 gnl/Carplike_NY0171/1318_a1785_1089:323-2161(+)